MSNEGKEAHFKNSLLIWTFCVCVFIVVFLSKMRLFVCDSPCFLGLKIGAECCVLPSQAIPNQSRRWEVWTFEGAGPWLTPVNKRRILLNLQRFTFPFPFFNLFNILLTLVSVSTRLLSNLFGVAEFSLIFNWITLLQAASRATCGLHDEGEIPMLRITWNVMFNSSVSQPGHGY